MEIVIYHSRYGHTGRYARGLGEALACPLVTVEEAKKMDLRPYRALIYGESIYAGTYSQTKFLADLMQADPTRHYIFFSVSLADSNLDVSQEYLRQCMVRALGEIQVITTRPSLILRKILKNKRHLSACSQSLAIFLLSN